MILMFVVESNPSSGPAIQQAIVNHLREIANPEVARTTQKFFQKKISCFRSVYLRRAALVTLIKLGKDRKILNFVFKIVRTAVPATKADDLVAKAAGWLLREAGKTDRRLLEQFLLRSGKRLPRVIVRYALEKFGPGRRAYFMKQTKK